jgi:hypothetical protein
MTATKPFYVTTCRMTGFAGQNLTRFYLTVDGKWTPNRAKGRAFDSVAEAKAAIPSTCSASIEQVS